MVYTSYFSNKKHFPAGAIPVSIALRPPGNYCWNSYPDLFPPKKIFMDYKDGLIDWATYKAAYWKKLESLDMNKLIDDFHLISNDKDFILLCYEKEGFCHRHIVEEFLKKHSFPCEELPYDKKERKYI